MHASQAQETAPERTPQGITAQDARAQKKTASRFGVHVMGEYREQARAQMMKLAAELEPGIIRYDVHLPSLKVAWLDELLAAIGPQTDIILNLRTGASPADLQSAKDQTSRPPEDIEQYQQAVKALVSQCKRRVKYWQIENEIYGAPNQYWIGSPPAYVKMLNAAYDAIKLEDPAAKILLPGIALADIERLPDVPEDHMLGYSLKHGKYDIVDLHLYYRYQVISYRLDWLRQTMRKFGCGTKPVWVTEVGGVDLRAHGLAIGDLERSQIPLSVQEEMRLQAEELVKRFVLILEKGVERVLWHKPFSLYTVHFWSHMALAHQEGTKLVKHPSFFTYQLMVRKLGGFTKLSRLGEGLYEFTVDSKPILVLWSDTGGKAVDMSKALSGRRAKTASIVTELDSKGQPVIPPEESVSSEAIRIDKTPLFVAPE
jgi:hypothetical protein